MPTTSLPLILLYRIVGLINSAIVFAVYLELAWMIYSYWLKKYKYGYSHACCWRAAAFDATYCHASWRGWCAWWLSGTSHFGENTEQLMRFSLPIFLYSPYGIITCRYALEYSLPAIVFTIGSYTFHTTSHAIIGDREWHCLYTIILFAVNFTVSLFSSGILTVSTSTKYEVCCTCQVWRPQSANSISCCCCNASIF